MAGQSLQRVYVILGQGGEGQTELLCRWVEELLPHLVLSSNLYVFSPSLPGTLRQTERVLETLGGFLRDQPLLRVNLHLCHPALAAEGSELRASYQALERLLRPFNQEGYLHQEVPRLLLMPIVMVGRQDHPARVAGLLQFLRRLFFIPSLYLPPGLLPEPVLLAQAERVYRGREEREGASQALRRLADYAVLDDSLVRLEAGAKSLAAACGQSLIVSAADGALYGCPRAYWLKKALGNIYGAEAEEAVPAGYGASLEAFAQRGDCLRCREEVAGSFLRVPEAKREAEKLGALLYTLGNLHLERGDYPAAVASLEKASGLVGASEIDHLSFRLGLAYLNLGRHEPALERLSGAAGTYGSQYYFHFYVGLCRYGGGEPGPALGDFARALELGPPGEDRVQILIYQGTCLNSLGRFREAAASLEEAKRISGSTKEICNALGFSYYKLKDYDLAIANLSEAVRLDPSSAIDYASLGTNFRAKGETAEAIRMYEKALELDPELEFARRGLEELRKGG